MLSDDNPRETAGPENIEIAFRPPVTGRILSERFLVEEDLSDPSLAGRYTSHLVKDLRFFCRNAILNILNFTPEVESGPSIQQVCEALVQISHPNIEKVIDMGAVFDGRPYSLTERPRGERLEDLIGNGKRLELELAARIIEQTAEGLAAAHKRGILHCDLRPSNLVVSNDLRHFGSVTIVHFGAAWPVDVRGDRFVHLPPESDCFAYAAPETYAKLGHRSTASDLYSLAVIAYRLLTGRLPYGGATPVKLVEQRNRGEWVPPTELRTDLSYESESILLSGLQFEPAWRPQNIEDFAYRLVSSLRPVPQVSRIVAKQAETAEPINLAPMVEADESAELSVRSETPTTAKTRRRIPTFISDRAVAWVLIVLLLAGALSIPIAQTLLKEEKAEAAVGTMLDRTPEDRSKRQLRFWIESKSADRPVAISEVADLAIQDAQISLVSDSSGEIYVIGESTGTDGRIIYKLLSHSAVNETIQAGKEVRTSPVDPKNNRALWILWIGKRYPELETDLSNAVADIPVEESVRKLRHFLERNRNFRLEVGSDDRGNETVLNGVGDKIVYRVSFPEN